MQIKENERKTHNINIIVIVINITFNKKNLFNYSVVGSLYSFETDRMYVHRVIQVIIMLKSFHNYFVSQIFC